MSRPQRMTADEFVLWAIRQPEGMHYELDAGEVVWMAPERSIHARLKLRVARRLEDAVAEAGCPCSVYPDGMAVRVDEHTVFEPDAMVRCGPELDDDDVIVTDPLIVGEIRSPSTGHRDTDVKLAGYFRIPSVRHYLIVVPASRTIIHHARAEDGTIATKIVTSGPVPLDPPGIVLDGVWSGSTPA